MTDIIIAEEKKELTQEEKDKLVQDALVEMTQVYSEGFKEMGQIGRASCRERV